LDVRIAFNELQPLLNVLGVVRPESSSSSPSMR
jgi:hypothetical protein